MPLPWRGFLASQPEQSRVVGGTLPDVAMEASEGSPAAEDVTQFPRYVAGLVDVSDGEDAGLLRVAFVGAARRAELANLPAGPTQVVRASGGQVDVGGGHDPPPIAAMIRAQRSPVSTGSPATPASVSLCSSGARK